MLFVNTNIIEQRKELFSFQQFRYDFSFAREVIIEVLICKPNLK